MGSCGGVQSPAVVREEELVGWWWLKVSRRGWCQDCPVVYQSDSKLDQVVSGVRYSGFVACDLLVPVKGGVSG